MTDRLSSTAAPHTRPAVDLRGGGRDSHRLWARLVDGRYLEVRGSGDVVIFDLRASAELGQAVIVSLEEGQA